MTNDEIDAAIKLATESQHRGGAEYNECDLSALASAVLALHDQLTTALRERDEARAAYGQLVRASTVLTAERDAARAECEAMRAVVEAASVIRHESIEIGWGYADDLRAALDSFDACRVSKEPK